MLKFAQNCVHVSLTGVWLAENVFITGQFEWVSFQLRFFLIVFTVLRTFLLAGSSQNIEDKRKTKGSAICLVREDWYWEDNDLARTPLTCCLLVVCVGINSLSSRLYQSTSLILREPSNTKPLPSLASALIWLLCHHLLSNYPQTGSSCHKLHLSRIC